jgi:hypothetical protein
MPTRDSTATKRAAVMVAGVTCLVATACSGAVSPTAVPLQVITPATSAARGAAATSRLTLAQARAEYSKISAPFNAAVATVNPDARDGTPWSKYKADVLAAAAANQTWARKVRAVRWPAGVQPYIDAMLKTEVPAEIQCYSAMAAAGSLQRAAAAFSGDSFCRDSTATADKVRSILHLPPTIG